MPSGLGHFRRQLDKVSWGCGVLIVYTLRRPTPVLSHAPSLVRFPRSALQQFKGGPHAFLVSNKVPAFALLGEIGPEGVQQQADQLLRVRVLHSFQKKLWGVVTKEVDDVRGHIVDAPEKLRLASKLLVRFHVGAVNGLRVFAPLHKKGFICLFKRHVELPSSTKVPHLLVELEV